MRQVVGFAIAVLTGFSGFAAPSPPAVLAAGQAPTASRCDQSMAEAITHIALPAAALSAVATRDACAIFVRTENGLSVLRRRGEGFEPARSPISVPGFGDMALTRDDALLVVRAPRRLVVFDVVKLMSGHATPLIGVLESAKFSDPANTFGPTFAVTSDNRFLIAAHHSTAWISVIDLDKVRGDGPTDAAIIAGAPTSINPASLRLSPDERHILVTHGPSDADVDGPHVCRHSFEGNAATEKEPFRRGGVTVFDTTLLRTKPSAAFQSEFTTGCQPIAIALSPDSSTLYSVSRSENVLLAFDVSRIGSASSPRLIGRVPVDIGPRNFAVVEQGRTIVAAHGYELAPPGQPTSLLVIDAAKVAAGAGAVRGRIPTRSGVVTLTVTADEKLLLVPNRQARTLQIVDLTRLPLAFVPTAEQTKP